MSNDFTFLDSAGAPKKRRATDDGVGLIGVDTLRGDDNAVILGSKSDAAWDGAAASPTWTAIYKYLGVKLEAIRAALVAALPAGTNIVGKFGIDQTTPGTTNGVQVNAAIPAGANLIGKVGIDQTTPGTTNGVVVTNGSVGVDASANVPTLPNVAAAFAGSGPYASYVRVATRAANPSRASISIENTSGAQIAVILDDGTAASAAPPANASVFALSGGVGAGVQGGSWSSTTEKGRIQVYAFSSSAQVMVREN